MSDSKEKIRKSMRSKTPDTGNSSESRLSPRKRNAAFGVGAVRSSNLEKAKDGGFIYRRRTSTGSNPSRMSPGREEGQESSPSMRKRVAIDTVVVAPALATTHKRMRTLHTNSSGEVVESDAFCWLCHKDGKGICCELCPRMFHLKCLGVQNVANDWVCPECEKILQAECADTRSKAMSLITLDQLCVLLKYSLQRMKHTESQDFHRPVDGNELKHYADYVHHPMDLSSIEKNVRKKQYGSTEAFLADAKYILHNCIVFNGEKHRLTGGAKMVIKICKHEMNEIEICPDCYMNSCTKQQENWFCEPCRKPHALVWAKMKGYPYWPAKALREVNGQFDVRFFGEHDRAWVPVGQVFLLSHEPPISVKKGRGGYDKSMEELELHIQKLIAKFGTFEYAPNRLVYDPNSHLKNTKDYGKTPKRTPGSSPASTPTSSKSRSPISSPGSRTGTPKSPEKPKSALTKTASAVKLKYSSIISTRHSKQKGLTIGDNVVCIPKKETETETETGNSSGERCVDNPDVQADLESSEPALKKARLDEDIVDDKMDSENQSTDNVEGTLENLENTAADAVELGEHVAMETSKDNEGPSRKLSIEDKDDSLSSDPSMDKVFLLTEFVPEELIPKLQSPLKVVPKIKLPDRKIISNIEDKIKMICDDVVQESTDKESKTDLELSDKTDHPDKPDNPDKPDKTAAIDTDETREKSDISESVDREALKSGSISPVSESVDREALKSGSISPVVIHSEDEGSKCADEPMETELKKNPFLEKLVASCKEKLGVDEATLPAGDSPSKSSSSEESDTDDDSTSSADSSVEKTSDKGSAKDVEHNYGKEKSQTPTSGDDEVITSSVPGESPQASGKSTPPGKSPQPSGRSSPALVVLEEELTEKQQEHSDKPQEKDVDCSVQGEGQTDDNLSQSGKSTPTKEAVPMDVPTPSEEAVPSVESTPADKPATPEPTVVELSDKECSEDEMIIDMNDSSNEADQTKSTPERTTSEKASDCSSPKVIDIVPIEIEETTTHVHVEQVDLHKKSPGTNKVKPQLVSGQKPQTATIIPEKSTTPQKGLVNGTSSSPPAKSTPGDFSPVVPEIDLNGLDLAPYTNKVMTCVKTTFQDFCGDMIRTEMGSVFRQHLQLEVKRLEWRHQQELNEVKHTANLKLLELRAAMELDKEKALDRTMRELKNKYEREKKQAIDETKKKQWCGNCGKEAIFYCCWNTSYCDYPCQQAHWPEHMSSCTQSQNSQQSADTSSNQSEGSSSSVPVNMDSWQPPTGQTGNRMVPQVAPVINNSQAQPLYIGNQPQRLPAQQIGGSVLQYIQPTSSGQQFQRSAPPQRIPGQYQLGGMNPMHAPQPQPPLVMSIGGHQPQLRPMMSQSQQSLLIHQSTRMPPTIIPGSTLQYRPNTY